MLLWEERNWENTSLNVITACHYWFTFQMKAAFSISDQFQAWKSCTAYTDTFEQKNKRISFEYVTK